MGTIHSKGSMSIEFTLKWKSSHASHTDCYFAKRINLWTDFFTQKAYDMLMGKRESDSIEFPLRTDEIVPPFEPENEFFIEQSQFDRRYFSSYTIEPQFGRFYPKGILRGIQNVFRDNIKPFRCIGITDTSIKVDFNHPISHHKIKVIASVRQVREELRKLGGECIDWMEIITDGPGMQARYQGNPTDFISDDSFKRDDESDDLSFYSEPRLVTHVDDQAISTVREIYYNLLKDGMMVLDLMSSWRSHLPENLRFKSVTGLGLNTEEMEDNPQLTRYKVHDLNKNYHLPFRDGEFDAVICSFSVDYMTQPFGVFEDVARILKQQGYFILTFSNRWFTPKVAKIWSELHEFERIGLVLEYFLRSGQYKDLETYSIRGLPRPMDDKYYPQIQFSDPIYAVWGAKA